VSADHDEGLDEALDAARTAHQVAYAEARRVLNYVPPGALDLGALTDEQRRVVQRWQATEADYDRLRRSAYAQAERSNLADIVTEELDRPAGR